jgi:hypothetical protein
LAYLTPDNLAKSGTERVSSPTRFVFAGLIKLYRYGIWFADHDEAYGDQQWRDKWTLRCEGEAGVKWFHAIRNQHDGSNVVAGAKAKAEGVKAGVADMFFQFQCL